MYEFLDHLEDYLGKSILRLGLDRPFEHLLRQVNDFLPSSNTRSCTRPMKIRPFVEWIGQDEVVTCVGIRAEEPHDGYKATKPNIAARFPLKEDGLLYADVAPIPESPGLGWPNYCEWRNRPGWYFCFFQRKAKSLALTERHCALFENAKAFSQINSASGQGYNWSPGETLDQLVARSADIRVHPNGKRRSKNASSKNCLAQRRSIMNPTMSLARNARADRAFKSPVCRSPATSQKKCGVFA